MLEFDDIQHILLTRPPALAARYEFLSFRAASGGRAWLSAIRRKCVGRRVRSRLTRETLGLGRVHLERPARLGVDEASLATFPEEFRQGMAARAKCSATPARTIPIIGSAARQAPTCTPSRFCSRATRPSGSGAAREHRLSRAASRRGRAVVAGSRGDAALDYARDHFGYRDRLTTPEIEGTGTRTDAGIGTAGQGGGVHPRLSTDENGPAHGLPQPEILSRNGSYMAYRRLEEHVGAFRDFLRQHAATPEEQELVAAKLMGRWRSGAPLVLAPDKDDPAARPRTRSATTISTTARWTRTATPSRSARTSGE